MKRSVLTSALLFVALAGCSPGGRETLVVATNLPAAECRAIEAAVTSSWHDGTAPVLVWVRPETGEPPAALVEHGTKVDVVLEGPPWSFDRLARRGLLDADSVRTLPRPEIALAVHRDLFEARAMRPPEDWSALTDPRLAGQIGLDDPRRDAASFAFAAARLREPSWAAGYAALVLAAANARPIGLDSGVALARWSRAEVALTPAFTGSMTVPDGAAWLGPRPSPVAGVAIAATAPHRELARRFLEWLKERLAIQESARSDGADDVLAELLGATMVEAQPELVRACAAWLRMPPGERKRQLEHYLTEAPPWPPLSVQNLRDHGLVETLAGQIAPGLDARGWLLQSWEQPPRPIDGARLHEIAAAAGGKLALDARFRDWLRAEWITWARQNARRVTREAQKGNARS